MRAGRIQAAALLAALAAAQTGCWPKKKPKVPEPPVVSAPQREPAPAPAPQLKPMEEPQTPPAPLPQQAPEPTVIRPKLQPPPPPPPAASTRRPRNSTARPKPADPKPAESKPAETKPAEAATPAQPAPETPPQPAPQSTGPKLGEVLPEAQRKALLQSIEENLGEARRHLAGIQGRALNREQAENAARVRMFIKQAEDARKDDVPAAAELSRRAALLARDLVDGLK